MATVRSGLGTWPRKPVQQDKQHSDKQRRHNRTIAVLIVVGLLALLALIVWLASFGNSATTNDYYWMIL